MVCQPRYSFVCCFFLFAVWMFFSWAWELIRSWSILLNIHDNASWPTNIEYYNSVRVLKILEGCVWKESVWNMTWLLQMWSTSTTQKTWCHFVPKFMFACIDSTMLLWRTEFDRVDWHTLYSIVASRCITWPKVFLGAVESGWLYVITVLLSPISGVQRGLRWDMGYLGARGCFRFQRYQVIWLYRLLMPKVDQHELRKMVFDHEIIGIYKGYPPKATRP